eukprot:Selendium_serpulae@DN764_c0_g1_i1.p1
MQTIQATILPPPFVGYGRGLSVRPDSGQWALNRLSFKQPISLEKWAIVSFDDRITRHDADIVTEEIRRAGEKLAIFSRRPVVWFLTDKDKLKQDEFQKALQEFQLVVVLIFRREDKYDPKYLMELSVPTQFLWSANFRSANSLYWSNVMSKVNLKARPVFSPQGLNHDIDDKTREIGIRQIVGNDGLTIILAASMSRTKLAPGETKLAPCVVGLVGSIDKDCLSFAHSVRALPSTATIIPSEVMQDMFEDIIYQRRQYSQEQTVPPKRIIFIRDGVAEGQFETALAEPHAIGEWYRRRGIDPPKITFIITQRRHMTRFFHKNPAVNAPAGTVVFDDLTHPTVYPNFYLLSHAELKGTSRPCRYFVLRDDNRIQRDVVLHGMFQLCHVYGRAPKSISVPAPCRYAKVLVERCFQHAEVQIKRRLGQLTSDTDSLISEGSAKPSSNEMVKIVNDWFRELSTTAGLFFYC